MEIVKATAFKAAKAAGAILKEKLGNISSIDYKSAFNIVTDVDKASELEVIRIISEQFPDHKILGEESGSSKTDSSHRWLIDPLDGTTNYTHCYPFFCVSIGYESQGEMLFGVVFNPVSGEMFWAEKGKGAYVGEAPLSCSKVPVLAKSLLVTGFPPDTKNSSCNNMDEFARLTDLSHGVRRDGAAALDLCFVAAGRLDGFWEYNLAPWDLAAGTLIVLETGGKVTACDGSKFNLHEGHVLATNGLIHQELTEALQVNRTTSGGKCR